MSTSLHLPEIPPRITDAAAKPWPSMSVGQFLGAHFSCLSNPRGFSRTLQVPFRIFTAETGVVALTFNPSTQEAEAGGVLIAGTFTGTVDGTRSDSKSVCASMPLSQVLPSSMTWGMLANLSESSLPHTCKIKAIGCCEITKII